MDGQIDLASGIASLRASDVPDFAGANLRYAQAAEARAATQGQQIQNRQAAVEAQQKAAAAQQTLYERQVMGRARQAATDPATGKLDHEKFSTLVSNTPGMSEQTINSVQGKMLTLRSLDNMPNDDPMKGVFQGLAQTGMFDHLATAMDAYSKIQATKEYHEQYLKGKEEEFTQKQEEIRNQKEAQARQIKAKQIISAIGQGFQVADENGDVVKSRDFSDINEHPENYHVVGEKPKPGWSAGFQLTPEQSAALNTAVEEGRIDFYKVNSRTAPLYANAELQHPGTDWNKVAAGTEFARQGSTMTSLAILNSIDPALDKLLEKGKALGNTDAKFLNAGVNFIKDQFGNSSVVEFNQMRDDMVMEVQKALTGAGVSSEARFTRAVENIGSAQNYPQLKSSIQSLRDIVHTRQDSMRNGPYAEPKPEKSTMQTLTPDEARAQVKAGKLKSGDKFLGTNGKVITVH